MNSPARTLKPYHLYLFNRGGHTARSRVFPDRTGLPAARSTARAGASRRTERCNLFSQFGVVVMLMAALSGIAVSASNQEAELGALPLRKDLGHHRYPISTRVQAAQDYFNQALILSFGFNHAEAARSFREAAKHDPDCAMCYWGEALVLGPNINAKMDDSAVPEAYAAIQKASGLTKKASPKENALIDALAARYAKEAGSDRSSLDIAYADAMREVAKQFPEDPVIAALFAESLMDLHPWNFWTKQGKAQPWTPEIVSTVERALDLDSNNPLANHLYIHALEASLHPEKALPSARRLAALAPGSGHLVHMPAHIFIRIGHYREAVQSNQAAVKIDHDYLSHSHAESIYTKVYVPHNFHFLWAAAIKSGQKALSIQAAKETAANVDRELMHDPNFSGVLQHYWLIPLYTKALFGQWKDVLSVPAPAQDLLYVRGIRYYARGLALTRQGKSQSAREELERLREVTRNSGIDNLTIAAINPVKSILGIAEAVLAGEIAAQEKGYQAAVKQLQKAIDIEDSLHYTEPKDWYPPTRQILGAILLEAGDPAMAEKVFRQDLDDHPQNGWSLFGLLQSLKSQGKKAQTQEIQKAYDEAWQDADIALESSRF